jgi:hypothetical protein
MALSERFRELESRLSELRKNLLPAEFSPTGQYSDKEQDCARGYRLLAHAEIESYLEDISRETVTEAIRLWKKERKPSRTLISFLASYHSSWNVNDQISNEEIIQIAKSRINAKESIDKVIVLAQKQYLQRLKDNHGIKENNLFTLIVPAGVDVSELDSTWLTDLNNFGGLRGNVAHNSKLATGEINPKDELSSINSLLLGLKQLDKKMGELF